MRSMWSIVSFVLLAVSCARQPDAETVRAAILDMADASGNRRLSTLLAHVSDDFTGNGGSVDRAGLKNLLRARLLSRGIEVRPGPIGVDVAGERATARFDASVTDSSGRWIVGRSTTIHFVTGWRREGRTWRCYNAQWTREDG